MARIFITGSADGLGMLAAKKLIASGHQVVVHARNAERATQLMEKVKGSEKIVIGDLGNMEETKDLAAEVNKSGTFDAIIHNAGVYQTTPVSILTVNVLAPYILSCLINKPKRLIYLSSGMHLHGKFNPEDFNRISTRINYSDSKLHIVMLSKIIARQWNGVYANAVDPGWVPTKMGGKGAPDDLQKGFATQVWLATSNDKKATVSGRYFHHQEIQPNHPLADNTELQDSLIAKCEELTGIMFPNNN